MGGGTRVCAKTRGWEVIEKRRLRQRPLERQKIARDNRMRGMRAKGR
jgi:hypothetical protein